MGEKVFRSRGSIIALPKEGFIDQKILLYEETCSFDNKDIGSLKANVTFSSNAIFKPFDALA